MEAKLEHVDEATEAALQPISARQEAYKRIIELMKTQLATYYKRYPDRAVDERSQDAEDWSIRGIRDILRILDDYNISFYTPSASNQTEV